MQHMQHVLFHGSPHVFERPSYGELVTRRTGHANGLLGLWAAYGNDWITNFGEQVYQVEAAGQTLDITVNQLRDMGDDPQYFIEQHQALLEAGCDILRLIEKDGHSEMCIVINFEAIKEFRRLPAPEPEIRKSRRPGL